MATSDKSKREQNMAAASVRRPAGVPTDIMLLAIAKLWADFKWPEAERPLAMRWAGGIERLYKYMTEREEAIAAETSGAILCNVITDEIRTAVKESKACQEAGSPAASPLEIARSFKIPLEVVFHVADGEPEHIVTKPRPWARRSR